MNRAFGPACQRLGQAPGEKAATRRWSLSGWTGLLTLALLAALGIAVTSGPTRQASAAQKACNKTDVAQALRPIPGVGQKLDPLAVARIIDQEIQARLDVEKLKASPLAED